MLRNDFLRFAGCLVLLGSGCAAAGGKVDAVSPTPDACTPQCTGRDCGPDGCGGSCGQCGNGRPCEAGVCGAIPADATGNPDPGVAPDVEPPDVPLTDSPAQDSPAQDSPGPDAPLPDVRPGDACARDCTARQCGDDGCGGSCGDCPGGHQCHRTTDSAICLLVGADGIDPDGGRDDADPGLPDADVPSPDGLATDEVSPPVECRADAECIASKGPTFACNCEFKCIEVPDFKTANGCTEDKNCGSEAFCDGCSKTCRPLLAACEACDKDEQCSGMMSRCVDTVTVAGMTTTMGRKVCAPWCPLSTGACAVDGVVPDSYLCARVEGDDRNGVCVPATLTCGGLQNRCKDDSECGLKEKCWEDLHLCGCRTTLDCGFAEACHPGTHRCVPGCTTDSECGSQKVCSAGLCKDACTGSQDDHNVVGCDDPVPMEGKVWDCVNGHCAIRGMCFSAIDCPEPETYCDATTRTCKSGCLIDFDCKQAAKLCDTANKVCVDRGCDANFWCSCGEVCNRGEKECETAEGRYCQPCVQKQQESDPEPCGDKETLCIGFKDPKTDEDKGSYCMPPCGPDPANPCPQGWQCLDVTDADGQSMGRKCIRFCYTGGCPIITPPALQ